MIVRVIVSADKEWLGPVLREVHDTRVDLSPRLADIAGGLGDGSPPAGFRGRTMVGILGRPPEAGASLSTSKLNMRFGEIKCNEINK